MKKFIELLIRLDQFLMHAPEQLVDRLFGTDPAREIE
jgi:hypothetical protein